MVVKKVRPEPLTENGVKDCRLVIVAPRSCVSCAIQPFLSKFPLQDLEEAEMDAFVMLFQESESE